MARTRQERLDDFERFRESSEETFKKFKDKDSRARDFQIFFYGFIVQTNIFVEQIDIPTDRRVQVYWGKRNVHENNSEFEEEGATLLFERDDSGSVIILIYPATTKRRKQTESSIILKLWIDPKKLKNKRFLKKLWNNFMAYMECTSLDGNPTFLQKQKISYFRYFKHLLVNKELTPPINKELTPPINKELTPPKFYRFRNDVVKWALATFISGIIVSILSHFFIKWLTKN